MTREDRRHGQMRDSAADVETGAPVSRSQWVDGWMDEIELKAKMAFDAGEWLRLTPEPHFHLPSLEHSPNGTPSGKNHPQKERKNSRPFPGRTILQSRAQVALAPDTTAVTLTQERQRRGMWRP